MIIVSEFNELDVAKELMSDSINTIGFVRADTGDDYPYSKKIVIASVGFTKSELPQVYQLIVGNLAQLTLSDADTIRKYSNLTAC